MQERCARADAPNAEVSSESHVFLAPHGGFLMNLNRDRYRALKQARLEDFRFHDLRHTFASRLMMAGVDLYRVQTLMGTKQQL
jgi:integrase